MADLSSYINITANTVTTANLSATGNVSSNSVISTTGNITGAAGVFKNVMFHTLEKSPQLDTVTGSGRSRRFRVTVFS